jgi:phosphoglycolate phosphatase-like HAD superfamily hydrolase
MRTLFNQTSVSNVKLEACIGVSETLDLFKQAEIRSLGLITGNMQELVAPKLQSASLPANMFIVGAYGSDHENRNRLPEIATMRAKQIFGKSFPPATVLIVGDTPLDIGCARYFGSKVLAVSTGIYSISELEKHKPDYLMKDLSNHKLLKELFLDEK